MKDAEFIRFWQKEYPNSFPIRHELKWIYENRWFRIHSLPESKRYAETEDEYKIILDRQNQLIEDLIGEKTEFVIVYGLYSNHLTNDKPTDQTDFGEFNKALTINLTKERPEEYEDEMYFDIFIRVEKWQSDNKNEMLRAIADDEFHAMFICPAKHCIVAPYDGGIDIIMDSTVSRDKLKLRYKDWISEREDGL
ncbi:hypothetical protein J1N10_15855 [Carboxylicivirga sp. A043]|uniref:DUF3885 domain-containing protein n=1 Tax=Carboxylicivirga litoralis TaxID=2816963 RepID=UPI0021CAEC46|nr:hypothetical protein [Carboxylicivirga sp. A043]MCU4157452.1 hypothetical protein [Carboxylicivirga sp. A043]